MSHTSKWDHGVMMIVALFGLVVSAGIGLLSLGFSLAGRFIWNSPSDIFVWSWMFWACVITALVSVIGYIYHQHAWMARYGGTSIWGLVKAFAKDSSGWWAVGSFVFGIGCLLMLVICGAALTPIPLSGVEWEPAQQMLWPLAIGFVVSMIASVGCLVNSPEDDELLTGVSTTRRGVE